MTDSHPSDRNSHPNGPPMFLLDSSTPEPTAPVSSAGALLRALARTLP